jgi:UDP-N-acetylmuramate dehydrogenase
MITTINKFSEIIKGRYFSNEPMERHTTFRAGGRVGVLAEPADAEDLKNILKELMFSNLTWKVIGNGSNILAGDTGLPDVVIKLSNINTLNAEGNTVTAYSGVALGRLVNYCAERGLSGSEFLAGIPGVVGGSIKGNTGAQGKSIAEILKEIIIMDNNGNVFNVKGDEIPFSYRSSGLPDHYIVLGGVFSFASGDKDSIKNLARSYLARRKEIFPTEPNAGCVFKNPKDMSAGKIIDRLGLKGFTIGKAMVSSNHANIIVNLGGACAMDVASLMRYVQDEVYKKTEIRLEPEIIFWGDV